VQAVTLLGERAYLPRVPCVRRHFALPGVLHGRLYRGKNNYHVYSSRLPISPRPPPGSATSRFARRIERYAPCSISTAAAIPTTGSILRLLVCAGRSPRRMKRRALGLLMLAGLYAAGIGAASAAAETASAPRTAMNDLDAVMGLLAMRRHGRVEFIEQQFLAVLDHPIESSGELRYDAPDHLEKRTLLPRSESLVLAGGVLTWSAAAQACARPSPVSANPAIRRKYPRHPGGRSKRPRAGIPRGIHRQRGALEPRARSPGPVNWRGPSSRCRSTGRETNAQN